MRNEDSVELAEGGAADSLRATQMPDPAPQCGIGDQARAVDLDDDRAVPESSDPVHRHLPCLCIEAKYSRRLHAFLNAVLPPIVAALRLPLMLLVGLVLILILDALMLLAADSITNGALSVSSFWSALGVALAAAAVGVVLDVVLGTNDDDTYTFRVIQRIARRSGGRTITDAPGIVFLEIDGLGLPVLLRAMRDGNAPTLARWIGDGTHRLAEWETDLSSQTGASQAGILLGSNDDIPAFRWVEKETAKLVACSRPPDCAEIERRHRSDRGLLADGGASRGNLLSGEADHLILTVSRMDAEKHANPGYRAFLANG